MEVFALGTLHKSPLLKIRAFVEASLLSGYLLGREASRRF
jgi:hypothetical protein